MPTKNMHIKGKSADSAPRRDTLPVDQSLSSKVSKPSKVLLEEYKTEKAVLDHFNQEVKNCIADGYAIEITVTGKDGILVKVLGDPTTKRPITADYDLLGTAVKRGNAGEARLLISDTELGADPDMGEVTVGQNKAIPNYNERVGRPDNPVVHHGAANSAPVNPGINYPVTAYEPNGNVVSIPEGPKGNPDIGLKGNPDKFLKEYFDRLYERGYLIDPHQDWGWERDPKTYKWSEK